MDMVVINPEFSIFSEFHPEWNNVQQTVFTTMVSKTWMVNIIQSPGIVIATSFGLTKEEASDRASRIAELLNKHGL